MYELGENIIDNCGNKAMFLSMLKAKGYNANGTSYQPYPASVFP